MLISCHLLILTAQKLISYDDGSTHSEEELNNLESRGEDDGTIVPIQQNNNCLEDLDEVRNIIAPE